MNLRIEPTGGATTFALEGRLDGTTVPTVEEAFLKAHEGGTARYVFDLGGLEYVSSAGLRVLLLAAKKTRAAGGKIALCGLSESVREVFEISGFQTIFAIYASREEAAAFVAQ
ncbi:STAS domain-containing protein [Paenibacillus sp. TRM 82003]|nr:STAS domain-containing protein [Paenibacillus sp. TRM 82003]